jgi:endonuclease/exonuclease/phosphatase (EEP) superfamily protein YafD
MSIENKVLKRKVTFYGLVEVVLILTSLFTITGFLGRFDFLLDLTSHFRVQYLVIQLLCLIFFLLVKRIKLAFITLPFLLVNLFLIVPFYLPSVHPVSADSITENQIGILLFNVCTSNSNYKGVIEYVKKVDPDILALEEINQRWDSELQPLLDTYKFTEICPSEDNFGIALYSKIPFEKARVYFFGEWGVPPSIVARIKLGKDIVTILFTHPLPPGNRDYFNRRNKQLEEIIAHREDFGDRLIVLGDLNMTSWSYYFERFKDKMNLKDTREGFGVNPSWPTMLPIMLIPIDHCLTSRNIVTLDRKIGANIGSDHYPVYIKLGI